ncbi:hypothetical protein [Streptomyces hoynatensis]|uniref:Uncharacterized protein n=1 Tax=Streptomyces hoynatensis TaxID=1141874 RepID=A0A3A9YFZ5_9ACTN|nr:hypothetical protein [Streptomyces hoynatensis]RKN35962.1 hypothetical protein D7294_30495 [Streptomyces hoynatensis]
MNITVTDVINAVLAVADEGPDHVYEQQAGTDMCRYTHESLSGTLIPGCLIGTALHRLGVPLERLERYEGEQVLPLLRALGIPVSYAAADPLREVQEAQDDGTPWGEAIRFLRGLDS